MYSRHETRDPAVRSKSTTTHSAAAAAARCPRPGAALRRFGSVPCSAAPVVTDGRSTVDGDSSSFIMSKSGRIFSCPPSATWREKRRPTSATRAGRRFGKQQSSWSRTSYRASPAKCPDHGLLTGLVLSVVCLRRRRWRLAVADGRGGSRGRATDVDAVSGNLSTLAKPGGGQLNVINEIGRDVTVYRWNAAWNGGASDVDPTTGERPAGGGTRTRRRCSRRDPAAEPRPSAFALTAAAVSRTRRTDSRRRGLSSEDTSGRTR